MCDSKERYLEIISPNIGRMYTMSAIFLIRCDATWIRDFHLLIIRNIGFGFGRVLFMPFSSLPYFVINISTALVLLGRREIKSYSWSFLNNTCLFKVFVLLLLLFLFYCLYVWCNLDFWFRNQILCSKFHEIAKLPSIMLLSLC